MTDTISVSMLNAALMAFEPFRPCAWYNSETDLLNFLKTDSQFGTDRIDGIFTLYRGLDDGEPVGFKVKGFRALYDQVTKIYGLEADEGGFVDLVAFIDEVFFKIATEDASKNEYDALRELARGQKAPPPTEMAA
jgi:hypothetical protein